MNFFFEKMQTCLLTSILAFLIEKSDIRNFVYSLAFKPRRYYDILFCGRVTAFALYDHDRKRKLHSLMELGKRVYQNMLHEFYRVIEKLHYGAYIITLYAPERIALRFIGNDSFRAARGQNCGSLNSISRFVYCNIIRTRNIQVLNKPINIEYFGILLATSKKDISVFGSFIKANSIILQIAFHLKSQNPYFNISNLRIGESFIANAENRISRAKYVCCYDTMNEYPTKFSVFISLLHPTHFQNLYNYDPVEVHRFAKIHRNYKLARYLRRVHHIPDVEVVSTMKSMFEVRIAAYRRKNVEHYLIHGILLNSEYFDLIHTIRLLPFHIILMIVHYGSIKLIKRLLSSGHPSTEYVIHALQHLRPGFYSLLNEKFRYTTDVLVDSVKFYNEYIF